MQFLNSDYDRVTGNQITRFTHSSQKFKKPDKTYVTGFYTLDNRRWYKSPHCLKKSNRLQHGVGEWWGEFKQSGGLTTS